MAYDYELIQDAKEIGGERERDKKKKKSAAADERHLVIRSRGGGVGFSAIQ